MKRLFALLVIVPHLAAAANTPECRFQQIEVDPFTKKPPYVATEKVRLTNWLMGVINREKGRNSEFQVSAVRERNQDFLALKIRLRRTSGKEPSGENIRNSLSVAKDAELLVLMADRSVIKLYSDEAVTGNTRYEIDDGAYVIDSSTTIRYRLDAGAAEQLTQQDAVRMRFNASGHLGFVGNGGKVDFEITKKARERFRQAIVCLQKLETVEQE
jgi:hypothetical protein